VIRRVPAPRGDPAAPLKALIIDSWFDNYVGVVMLVRVFEGTLRPKERILLMSTDASYLCEQVGVFTPKATARELLAAGEVGYVTAGVRELRAAKVGDTLTHAGKPARAPLPASRRSSPGVRRCTGGGEASTRHCATRWRTAPQRRIVPLRAGDSQALGFGFRCGFLGLLHMDIVQERLEREYGMYLITTAPSVVYEVSCATAASSRYRTRRACLTRL